MKKFMFLALLLSQFAYGTPECDYHFSISNATIQVEDTPTVIEQSLTVSRGQNSPNGRCGIYRVFFSKGTANNYQRTASTMTSQTLNYNLHRTINMAGILKDFSDAVSSSEYLEGLSPEKFTTYTSKFYISTPGQNNNVLAAGNYTDIIQATVHGFNDNSGNFLFENTESFTVLFIVGKKIQVSLLDEGQAFDPSSTSKTLDFGILSQNQEKGADLRILSNGPYKIRLSSLNNGNLKLSTANESISYGLKVNGSSATLSNSSSSPVEIGSGTLTSQAGDLYNLKVKISESTVSKSAGLYQDVVTITAIAN